MFANMLIQWRREGGEVEHAPLAALCRGRHLRGRKYGILKFGRFWRIGVCIADSDTLHPPNTPNTVTLPQFLDHTPTVRSPRPHTKQSVQQEAYTADLTDHSPSVKL